MFVQYSVYISKRFHNGEIEEVTKLTIACSSDSFKFVIMITKPRKENIVPLVNFGYMIVIEIKTKYCWKQSRISIQNLN